MNATASRLPAYVKLAGLQMQVAFAYRGQVIGDLLVVLLRILLLKAVWTAAYAGRSDADDVALPDLITFLTLGNLQLVLMRRCWSGTSSVGSTRVSSDSISPGRCRSSVNSSPSRSVPPPGFFHSSF